MTSVTKSIVLFGGAVTGLCLAAMIGWQSVLCFWAERCAPISVQQVADAAGLHISRTYFTSSVDSRSRTPLQVPKLLEPLLDVPAIVALLIAMALLLLFYASIRAFEARLERS